VAVLRSPTTWFLILSGICLGGPYILGVRPTTPRQWLYIAMALAFLAWLLPLMAPLR